MDEQNDKTIDRRKNDETPETPEGDFESHRLTDEKLADRTIDRVLAGDEASEDDFEGHRLTDEKFTDRNTDG